MERGRNDGVVVPDRFGSLACDLHLAVEVVEVSGGEPMEENLSEPGADGVVDLGAVRAQRRRRMVQALTLLQPNVKELAEGGPETVAP